MHAVFFYGLFMDEELLKAKGFHPTTGKIAFADGYGLRIGNRATLVKSDSERAYGVVMELSKNELDDLYSQPNVAAYIPEDIQVTELSGAAYKALCYNLPVSKLSGSNSEYAKSLSVVAQKIGIPQSYINEILTWVK